MSLLVMFRGQMPIMQIQCSNMMALRTEQVLRVHARWMRGMRLLCMAHIMDLGSLQSRDCLVWEVMLEMDNREVGFGSNRPARYLRLFLWRYLLAHLRWLQLLQSGSS